MSMEIDGFIKMYAEPLTGELAHLGIRGVGIKSVVQTHKSEENGGINIWTITLTDDTEYIFEVRNGDKGEEYTLEPSTRETLGGIIVGETLSISQDGVLDVPSIPNSFIESM